MYQYRTVAPADLTPSDAQAWTSLCLATPEFHSPLLGPEFARLVGRSRPDAAVTVVSDGREPIGFFAHHRRPGRLARPIGAPFSDIQAVVSRAGARLSGAELLRAIDIDRFKFQALVDPHGLFPDLGDSFDTNFTIDLTGAPASTGPGLSRNSAKKLAKKFSSLGRAHGSPQLNLSDLDAGSLQTLFRWKSAQLDRNGLQDFLAPLWVRRFMRDAFALSGPGFRGRLLTLSAGDRLVAGRFGVEANAIFHPWVSAYDPALADFSPGNLLLWKAIEALPAHGVHAIELGAGLGDHKRKFANREETVRGGTVELTPQFRYDAGVGANTPGPLARVARRLDQIALLEPEWPDRAASLFAALAAAPRRVRSSKLVLGTAAGAPLPAPGGRPRLADAS